MAGVTIIDYGIGNLLSVARAFEHCGAAPVVTGSPEAIRAAELLVLPGVGAFADGMQGLRDRGLIGPIKEFAASGRPFLGICLGMQMMLDAGEEFGLHEGLGLIPGKVVAIPSTGTDGRPHKIPHIGWSPLELPAPAPSWAHTILEGIAPGAAAYFVHSYTAHPSDAGHRLADCHYDGRLISAVVRSGSLYGCQFHPEKSGEVGLAIVRNFLRLGPQGDEQ
jgi:imidazole glycerol-phosphate synthase subunit HisH